MITRLIPALVSAIALCAGSVAGAQEKSPQAQPAGGSVKESVAQTKKACKSDIDKFCKNITPGEGRVAECLGSNESKLSSSCKKAKSETSALISEKMDKAELAFRHNCGGDVQKFCSNVPSGRGRLLDCLGEHESDLSTSCKDLQAKINGKLNQAMG